DAASRAAATHAPGEIGDLLNGGTMYTTMMPCEMCAGAIIRFAAGRVVVGETKTYVDSGTQLLMERQGIEVTVLQSLECVALVEMYLRRYPERRAAMTLRKTPALRL
ncbi:MAG: deaminase, partial [Gammaproteobacteria bacterium]|nr:deaminase [Gammaproteobacteria bacterium]